MIDIMLSLIAPHHCCGCGKVGGPLCSNCKYNIISDQKNVCIVCGRLCGEAGICTNCHVPYTKAWHVGPRQDTLQRLVGLYKFERMQSAHRSLSGLLISVVLDIPLQTVVVPVPTVPGHIRERGYDHMLLIAKHFAKSRHLRLAKLLKRSTRTKQRQSSAKQRVAQAKIAFEISGKIEADVPYLLIDDVMTTGATIRYAAQALKRAGAAQVWVAVIARQTLD